MRTFHWVPRLLEKEPTPEKEPWAARQAGGEGVRGRSDAGAGEGRMTQPRPEPRSVQHGQDSHQRL